MSELMNQDQKDELNERTNQWYLNQHQRLQPGWSPWTDLGYAAERYLPSPFNPLPTLERQTIDPMGNMDRKRWETFDAQRVNVQSGKPIDSAWTRMVDLAK